MKLIVGLGNPGIEYQFTPHNIGFLVLDRLAERLQVQVNNRHCKALTARGRMGEHQVLLAKPETWMNLSGLAVRELVAEHELDPRKDLIVIWDELDLPMGTLRVRERGSSAGHNGVESIIGALGTEEFTRVRVGMAPDHPVRDGARRRGAGDEPVQPQAGRSRRMTRRNKVSGVKTKWQEAMK